MRNTQIALNHFENLLIKQMERIEKMVLSNPVDYKKLNTIVIGVAGGDGIGPLITFQAQRVIEKLLHNDIKRGKIEIRPIKGLTIENRAKEGLGIPKNVLKELQECDVILKGPTTTPRAGDPWPNIESANVAMRKELDLYANIRPVKVPDQNIDWIFFRENTEGAYAAGDDGITLEDELAIDFTITSKIGTIRIIKAAFEYARVNNKQRVTAITKANIIKNTDGMFLRWFYEIAKDYPEIIADDWYIDIMTAKLIDGKRRSDFQVMVLPNLYGDILTDEAAEFQGGVGTAGSANVGDKYAMFEAIHGSAPRMVKEGRAQYADPRSVIRAAEMLLKHIGYKKEAELLNTAMMQCEQSGSKITGHPGGLTAEEYTEQLLNILDELV